MPWLHSLKTRHEQQNKSDYLKKDQIISRLPVNIMLLRIKTMFTLYDRAIRSVTNCISDRAFVHT